MKSFLDMKMIDTFKSSIKKPSLVDILSYRCVSSDLYVETVALHDIKYM